VKIVIIGFGSAGYAALMAIKRKNPGASTVVIDPKEKDLVHPCGLPYALEGIVRDGDLEQDVHLNKMGASRIGARALKISTDEQTITAQQDDTIIEVQYDRAVIAAGSVPAIPPIPGIEKALNNGLYTMTDPADLLRIRERLSRSRTAIVIGAGAIGLETAWALKMSVDRVIVVEMTEQILPGILDPDLAKRVAEHLADNAVELHLGKAVEEIIIDDGFRGVIAAGEKIVADVGICATGFRANDRIAVESSIRCDRGIVVDERLRTSAENVYAAGDCIAGWSVVDRKATGAKLATSAYLQGTVAGANAAGGDTVYHGTAATFVTRIGELEVAGTGYTERGAREQGYEPVVGKITTSILPEYFPGGTPITVKVIAERKSGAVLGAQAVGIRGAAERINLMSMAIEYAIPLGELPRLELAYCPPVSEVYDPLMRAIDFCLRRMK